MYHRRLINPFLHFKLSKCTKYEIVPWMALRDTFGNNGTNLHTTTLQKNAFQALLKTLWRKQDSFLPGQTLDLQATSVLTDVKQICGFLSSVCIQMRKHGVCGKWGTCTNFVGIIYHTCQNLEYWSYRSWICKCQGITNNSSWHRSDSHLSLLLNPLPSLDYYLALQKQFFPPKSTLFSASGDKKLANPFTRRSVTNPTANADYRAINKFRFQAINTNI